MNAQSLFINEIMPSNVSGIMDDLYDFPDSWVEIYNAGEEPVNIKDFFFSDSKKNKFKWQVPVDCIIQPKDYQILYFDKVDNGLHANFRLDINGSNFFIYDPNGELVDNITYPKNRFDISYGRVPDGGEDFGMLYVSSPGSTNDNTIITNNICLAPQINTTSCFFTTEAFVEVEILEQDAVTKYTLDGSEPTQNSLSIPDDRFIPITKTSVLKIKSFKQDFIPSQTISQTIFIDMHVTDLPIVSIGIDSRYLYDNTIGIHITGTNGIVSNCNPKAHNYFQDWRRPISVEYYESSHVEKSEINQTAEMRIGGGCTRLAPQKSFILYSNKRFGNNKFDYDLFKDKSGTETKSFILRAAGNDINRAKLRDPFAQSLIANNMNLDLK